MGNDSPILFIVSGPSGSGKGTFLSHISSRFPEVKRVQTFTTRPKRPNETDLDYHFIDTSTFLEKSQNGEIFEFTKTYDDYFYGSPRVLLTTEEPQDMMVELEVKGMMRLRALSARRVVSVFVMPPSMEALAERIRARHQEDNFEARLAKAKEQISYAYGYDYVLVNEVLDTFQAQAETIIAAERVRRQTALALRDRLAYLLQT